MKYLSVCSGIEAASVAWHPLGWEPLAFSEIEPFPRAVLQHHYPQVPLHGDFTALRNQPWIVDADVLVGGTPCQAFSVAGLRNSLADERGNLSLEYVRLADAIDNHRRMAGKDSAIIVWENVPGVLSVKDNAFGCFLAGLAGDVEPYVPPRGKWTNAGVVDGPQRSVAWRILDAQYFGLAQRRRRVFVIASAREGFDPAAVLLEFEGVRRDTPPRREAGQGFTHSIAPSLTSSGRGVERGGDTHGQDPVVACHVTEDLADTLAVGANQTTGFASPSVVAVDEVAETLIATDHKGPGHNRDHNFVTHSLRAEGFDASEDGTGRGTPLVPTTYSIMPQNSGKDYKAREVEVAQPIMAGGPVGGNQGGDYVLQPVAYRTTGNDGVYETGDLVHALTTATDPNSHVLTQPAAYAFQPRIARNGRGDMGDVVNALNAQSGETGKGDAAPCVAVAFDTYNQTVSEETTQTLCSRGDTPGGNAHLVPAVQHHMAVRRLTPVECERLQGFPDGYTNIPWRKKPEAPDGPRYKALGNSMAAPVMRWIGKRIANALA